jgi:hypothetical protein
VSDWDAIIGEVALGLDLARVDAPRNRPALALAQRAVAVLDKKPDPKPDTSMPDARPSLKLAGRPEPVAIDPDAIFREEALEFRARGRDVPGGVVRLGSQWLTWAYRVTLVLLAAAIASMWVIRTSESTTGPVAVDGRTGMVAILIPAAAGTDLTSSQNLTVVLPDGRSLRVTGLHAVLAGAAAIEKAGFTPLSQPAILVTGQADQAGPGKAAKTKAAKTKAAKTKAAKTQRTQATVILRSETVADVLARQLDAMLGQGTAP